MTAGQFSAIVQKIDIFGIGPISLRAGRTYISVCSRHKQGTEAPTSDTSGNPKTISKTSIVVYSLMRASKFHACYGTEAKHAHESRNMNHSDLAYIFKPGTRPSASCNRSGTRAVLGRTYYCS
eukprot:1369530-Pleurochrysis_carterae.AAC.1